MKAMPPAMPMAQPRMVETVPFPVTSRQPRAVLMPVLPPTVQETSEKVPDVPGTGEMIKGGKVNVAGRSPTADVTKFEHAFITVGLETSIPRCAS